MATMATASCYMLPSVALCELIIVTVSGRCGGLRAHLGIVQIQDDGLVFFMPRRVNHISEEPRRVAAAKGSKHVCWVIGRRQPRTNSSVARLGVLQRLGRPVVCTHPKVPAPVKTLSHRQHKVAEVYPLL